MAAWGGQVCKSWRQWRWAGRSYGGDPPLRLLSSSALDTAQKSNPSPLDLSMISSYARIGALTGGVTGERRSSCPISACLHRPLGAEPRGSRGEEKQEIQPNFWNRMGSSGTACLPSRPLLMASAVASGFVSPTATSSSSRVEHAEQLDEFYLQNEFLFLDEKWDDMSPLVKERQSLLIEAGRVRRGSRVLVWGGSAEFVQELCVATSPELLVVTHLSMTVLGAVKELNDDAVCWLGNIEDLPHSYGPFDSVFLHSLIAAAYSPAALLQAVVALCNPGARIVISCTEGRKGLAVCRHNNPQLILHSLPDAAGLQKMMSPLSVNLVELQDEPSFYLATLEVEGTSRTLHTQNGSGEVSGQQQFPLRARGQIVKGLGRGSKQLGIPTANIDPVELPAELLRLSKGVYFGWAQQDSADKLDGGVYKMVINIGTRPTFADGELVTVEAHILHNFRSDFYDKALSVIVLGFIRDEMRFSSVGDLVQRIKADIAIAEKLLDEDEMRQYASDDFFVR